MLYIIPFNLFAMILGVIAVIFWHLGEVVSDNDNGAWISACISVMMGDIVLRAGVLIYTLNDNDVSFSDLADKGKMIALTTFSFGRGGHILFIPCWIIGLTGLFFD